MVPATVAYIVIIDAFALLLITFIAMIKLIGDRIGDVGRRIDDVSKGIRDHIDDLHTDNRASFARINAELTAIRGERMRGGSLAPEQILGHRDADRR